jgi:hypothetical protein
MVIGAYNDDDQGMSSGAAYVYERQGNGTWLMVTKLLPPEISPVDRFGYAVSISGSRLVVGAPWDEVFGGSSGSAFVFERQGDGTWLQVTQLAASDGAMNDGFGTSVSISAGRLVVGAPQHDELGPDAGAAYVFERQGDGTWLEVDELLASDGVANDDFGMSVSISGDHLAVGTYPPMDTGSNSGSAYVFERQLDGTWLEVAKPFASNPLPGGELTTTVALSGGRLVVGAFDAFNPTSPGCAYVYEQQPNGTWPQADKLVASDQSVDDFFGWSVAISDERLVVGSRWDSVLGATAGSAYVYERGAGGAWTQTAKLLGSDVAAVYYFGHSVAISDDRILAGAPRAFGPGGLSGAAYLFEACGGPITPYASGCPGTLGITPSLLATGCASPGEVLDLYVEGSFPAIVYLFLGTSQASLPMKGGCTMNVFPVLGPFGPFFLSADVRGVDSLSLVIPPNVPPGSFNLQAFLADSGTVFFNSNGLEIQIP